MSTLRGLLYIVNNHLLFYILQLFLQQQLLFPARCIFARISACDKKELTKARFEGFLSMPFRARSQKYHSALLIAHQFLPVLLCVMPCAFLRHAHAFNLALAINITDRV